jgi:hypothetical protein
MAVAQARDRQAGGPVTNALEGKALAIASAMVKPAPVNLEPRLLYSLELRTPEKGGVRPPRSGRSTR